VVEGQQVEVGGDGGLVEGARSAVQLVQTAVADGVAAAKADGPVAAAVKLMVAHRARQELRPLGSLHRHPGGGQGSGVSRVRGQQGHMVVVAAPRLPHDHASSPVWILGGEEEEEGPIR